MKKIKLSKDLFAIVDSELFAALNVYTWHATRGTKGGWYARRICGETGKRIYMHRQVAGFPPSVDHINGNGLDNRLKNLRPCTHSENMRNRPVQKNNTSGYKGVYWNKAKSRWHTRIKLNGQHIHIGYFKDVVDAGKAYDVAIKEHYKEFAYPNFHGSSL